MQVSLYLMDDVTEICALLRKRYFNSESEKEYRTSYVICKAIEDLDDPQLIFDEDITKRDNGTPRMSKTLNLRTECYSKICALADTYNITTSESLRRALYVALVRKPEEGKKDSRLANVQIKIQLLKKQLDDCMTLLNEIEDAIN